MTKRLWLKIYDAKSYGATLKWHEMVSVSNEKEAQKELLKNVQKILVWLSQKWYLKKWKTIHNEVVLSQYIETKWNLTEQYEAVL